MRSFLSSLASSLPRVQSNKPAMLARARSLATNNKLSISKDSVILEEELLFGFNYPVPVGEMAICGDFFPWLDETFPLELSTQAQVQEVKFASELEHGGCDGGGMWECVMILNKVVIPGLRTEELRRKAKL